MAKKTASLEPAQILAFPFQDEKWLGKILIASLLVLFSFIPLVPVVLLLGYTAEIIQGIVVEGKAPYLPEWDDLSSFFNKGFRLLGIGAIYMIPGTLLISGGYLGIMVPVFLVELGGLGEMGAVVVVLIGYMAGFGLISIGVMLSMITGVILPIAGSHAIAKDDFRAAFKFNEIWEIFKTNWGGFVVAFLLLLGTFIVLYYGAYFLAATIILCCLYPFALCFMSSYLLMIGAGLFGEAYRKASDHL
jgi:hypothetical protein